MGIILKKEKFIIAFSFLILSSCMLQDQQVEEEAVFVPEEILLASENFSTYSNGGLSSSSDWDIETVQLNQDQTIDNGKIKSTGSAAGGANVYLGTNTFKYGRVEIDQRTNFDSSVYGATLSIGLRYNNNNGVAKAYTCIFGEGAINSNAGKVGVKLESLTDSKEALFNTNFNYDTNKEYTFTCEFTLDNELRAFVDGVLVGSMPLYFPTNTDLPTGYIAMGGIGTQELSAMRVYHYTGVRF